MKRKKSPLRRRPKVAKGAAAASARDLQKRLREALEQQTATAEILRVISSSPSTLQPVLDAVSESAARLCEASDAVILLAEGAQLKAAAHHGRELADAVHRPATRDGVAGRAVVDRATIHVADVQSAADFPLGQRPARADGSRTVLATPLMRGAAAIGAILIRRREVRPFSEWQIALLKTFADQAVIAIENVRLFTELEDRNRALTAAHAELTDALEQQTATSEILRVISSSPTDIQPVLDAVVTNAARFCSAPDASVFRLDGENLRADAHHGPVAQPEGFLVPVVLGSVAGRSVLDQRAVSVTDLQVETEEFPEGSALARQTGQRATLSVPLLREGAPIGAILLRRAEAVPFTGKQIALLRTFADQAVIAIENVRLFTELQEKNRALTSAHAEVTEALERQSATGDILRAISRAQTDLQPVFDVIAASARRLCDGVISFVFRHDGTLLHLTALDSAEGVDMHRLRQIFPAPPERVTLAGRVVTTARLLYIADIEHDRDAPPGLVEVARANGFRSVVAAPMLREGHAIGAIGVAHRDVNGFTPKQCALLETFADQAVIAIENVRLFTELQVSNRELTTALETQTATSDILRVISRSQTDLQPVFEAILTSAIRLLAGFSGTMTRLVDGQVVLVAFTTTDDAGDAVLRETFPRPLDDPGTSPQAIRQRAPINIADAQTDARLSSAGHAIARARAYHSMVAVPLLRGDEALGAIAVTRREPGGFTGDEIALLQTFADQAVIAIENARLLTELQTRTAELTRSVGELTALGEVGRALSSTLDLETVLQTIVLRANELAGTAGCTIWEYDEAREEFRLRASDYVDEKDAAALQTIASVTTIRRGLGVTGQVMERRQPVQIRDIAVAGADENPMRRRLIDAGHHALLAVPLLREDEVLGVLVVTRKAPGEFQPEIVQLLSTFATQSALAIQNARLFREIEIKSRELEVASQHKSEFLASMSHELRTPLNAIIGFSDVLLEGMFGEMTEKQTEYLRDILASGQHLLSLINDILDLSKIEAGRMELEMTAFHLPSAIDDALLLMRERAGRRGLALERQVDARLGQVRADQRKVKQVLLNLLSNAVKFTPEGGRIAVHAVPVEDTVEVSVTDSGIGIAPEDQEAVFEEFRQVGRADKKAEGTGLGLALCRKFVELHGGRIWVKSAVGQGSTFTFTLPVR